MEFQEFPKWKYHPDGKSTMVDDADAERVLGDDWFDHPALAQAALEKLRDLAAPAVTEARRQGRK